VDTLQTGGPGYLVGVAFLAGIIRQGSRDDVPGIGTCRQRDLRVLATERRRALEAWLGTADRPSFVVETTVGRSDDALGHLTEMAALSERIDNIWLAAISRVQLGIVDAAQRRLDDARRLLDGGLDLSLEARSTNVVTLCLAAFAWLTFEEGDVERAVLVAGAAEGLRRRAGGPACGCGRRCGEARQGSWPGLERRSGRTGSTRRLPPAPNSTANRRSPSCGTGAAQTAGRTPCQSEVEYKP
jgi:hypothetical protein